VVASRDARTLDPLVYLRPDAEDWAVHEFKHAELASVRWTIVSWRSALINFVMQTVVLVISLTSVSSRRDYLPHWLVIALEGAGAVAA
jgi:hypothetical protein